MDRPIDNSTPFGLAEAGSNPQALFSRWFDAAVESDARNAAVVALATASADARPSLRMVLLKGHGPDGFIFYTNYESRKAVELKENPFAAMTFWWPWQERQVRIEGQISKISSAESDAYFATRPRESRLGAWVYTQSSIIDNPATLDDVSKCFKNKDVPRPANWGGYRLIPSAYEFWQGRKNRLHDRIRFTQKPVGWKIERLAP